MDNVAIVVIVERGKADRIVDEAKKVGRRELPSFMPVVQEKANSRSFSTSMWSLPKRSSCF